MWSSTSPTSLGQASSDAYNSYTSLLQQYDKTLPPVNTNTRKAFEEHFHIKRETLPS